MVHENELLRRICARAPETRITLETLQMPQDHIYICSYLFWGNVLRLSLLLINNTCSDYD